MKNWPQEIKNFMKKKGVVLLIRGLPGTGKTIFTLTLMKDLKNSVFIAPKKVYDDIMRNYRWLDKSTKSRILVIDERYDHNPSDSFGNVFFLLPESFRRALNMVERGEIDTIILDSWHTIVEELKYKTLEERERRDIYDPQRFFLNIIKLSDFGVNIVINKEGDEDDELSYVADGVITLRKRVDYGRVYRWLSFEKLRGVEIRRSEYAFTLKNGKVKILQTTVFKHPKSIVESPKKDIKMGSPIPSVILDDVVNFYRGNTVLYDFEENIPKEYHLTLFMSTVANFLKNGLKTIIIPPNDMDINEIKYQIYLFRLEKYLGKLKIIYPEEEMEEFVKPTDFYNLKDIIESSEKVIEEGDMNPLVIIGYDRLFSFLEKSEIMQFLDYMRNFIRKRGGILIITGKISDKTIKNFSGGVADIYIKFKNYNGDVLMYGIKPWTHAYLLSLSSRKGYPEIIKEEII